MPKSFRPSAAPKPTTLQPSATVSQAPAKPKTDVPESRPPPLETAPVPKSTPWPGAGKCQVTILKTEIGYSHQIIWTMKTKMNIGMQLLSLALGPL